MQGSGDRADGPTAGPRGRARRGRRLLQRVAVPLLVLVLATPAVRTAVVLAGPGTSHGDVRAQLRFLDRAVADGAAARMQALFPEGYAFSHALPADAWAGLAGLTGRRADAAQARRRCLAAVRALAAPAGTAPFARVQDPPNGVFWAGWSLRLRAGAVELADRLGTAVPAAEQAALVAAVDDLVGAFDRADGPFLPSYPGQAWPVDSVVALSALRRAAPLSDRTAQVDAVVERWLRAAEGSRTGRPTTLPHRVDPATGALDGPRATSSALVLALLPEVDAATARRDWAAFRAAHVRRTLGFPTAREHPPGVDAGGDVDSGPLLLGVSLPATVVTLGAARANGDPGLAAALDDAAEVAGAPLPWRGTRRYAAGALPVGDALLVWARTRPLAAPAGSQWDRPPVWAAWTLLPLAAAAALVRGARRSGRVGPGRSPRSR